MPTNQPKSKGARGPRPHVWRVGPDENRHQMYIPWLKSKAQARYRGEEWCLEFEDFFALWDGQWHLRGRDPESLCMTRVDWELAWTPTNTIIVTRLDHLREQARVTRERYRSLGIKRRYKPRVKHD